MDLHLFELLLVLLASWLAGAAATRLGYSSVLGALLAGIMLGPPLFGLLHGSETLAVLAQVGALLMMLYVGMEIDPRELGRASWSGMIAAVGGFVVPLVLVYFIVIYFGGDPVAALFLGTAAGVTAIVATSRILIRLRLLDTQLAHVAMGGALVADTLALVAFATIVGVIGGTELEPAAVALVATKALLFFIVTAVAGLKVFPFIGRRFRSRGLQSRTFQFTFVLLVALAFGELAELAGLHAILGAFVAGLFLRENVLGRSLANDLMKAVRDASIGFLAPVFFITAGFAVSLEAFSGNIGLISLVVVAAIVGKILGTALFYLPTGRGWREGVAVGTAMGGRGEVEVVIAVVGLQMGLITRDIFSILIFMTIASSLAMPLLLRLVVHRLRRNRSFSQANGGRADTIIIGAGPLARALGRILSRTGQVRLIDTSRERCAFAKSDGLDAVCGNALEEQVLSDAGAGHAEMIIAMTGNAEVNALSAQLTRNVFHVPHVLVMQTENGSDGYEAALNMLNAATLFAGPVNQDEWDHWVSHDELLRTKVPVRTLAARTPVKLYAELQRRGECLPLALKRNGRYVPFHSFTEPRYDDEIVVLEPRRRESSSDAVLDRFDRLVASCPILDLDRSMKFDEFLEIAIAALALRPGAEAEMLADTFLKRERMHSSVLAPGLAVPHALVDGNGHFHLLVARSRGGIRFPGHDESVHSIFLILRSEDERTSHLRALSAIAQTVQDSSFDERWLTAWDAEELRRILLGSERRRNAEFDFPGRVPDDRLSELAET